ncbi:hypothetical protein BCR33DRAFT_713731 [Rhizoclosmatium globosum]|uniref:Transcription factor domain-containing protein n=1 Tax=Rhizoclosmatium globosum TaxID=329046 RepID=A0A1Y2CRB6_9FUNG|nr:hypothetical protein BCR33DRAFT_713731 [Rhizoclosmatium globosum]|eukprot:ORY49384.1 hypothetical protein BCR33DRAFT_713731 [Rhizoclosmatium globosum]
MALHLIRVLELDEDPDYLPSLNHLNSIEKEERRRVFWGLCTASRRKLLPNWFRINNTRIV